MTPFVLGSTEPTAVTVTLSPGTTQATYEFSRDRKIPITVPSNQEYYWSHMWQQGERLSLAALSAGDSIVFDSEDPEDIVRWLHADEDDAPKDADSGQD